MTGSKLFQQMGKPQRQSFVASLIRALMSAPVAQPLAGATAGLVGSQLWGPQAAQQPLRTEGEQHVAAQAG